MNGMVVSFSYRTFLSVPDVRPFKTTNTPLAFQIDLTSEFVYVM